MNHFFVEPENIYDKRIEIRGSDVKHIKNVLRMKINEDLMISDGQGHDYCCRISDLSDVKIVCDIVSKEISGNESSVSFYLFQGLPKADKLEHIIQKSVELGVFEIIPVQTARSIVRYDKKKQDSKLERWNRISESAAKQSRRGIIPEVHEIMSFEDCLKYASELDMVLMPYENFKDLKSTKDAITSIRPGMRVGIIIGPEGGFEQSEVDMACLPADEGGAGATLISLGPRILRTETAPLMLLSALNYNMELLLF